MSEQGSNPALAVARSRRDPDEVVVLSTGYRAKVKPVAASLIEEVTSKVEDPEIPMWHNPDKDRDEPNIGDPKYLAGLKDAARRRGRATVDAMVLFGVELVDPVPDEDGWLKKLHRLENRGYLDLGDYDLADPFDREFVFKRFVAVGVQDLERIMEVSAVTPEEVAKAKAGFQG